MSNSLIAGKYRAKPISAGLGFTKGGDQSPPKECVAVRFEVTEGELTGEQITWYGYFTDAAQQYTMANLRTCGWTGDDLYDLSSIDGTGDVSIVLVDDDFNGKVTLKVKYINAPGGGAMLNAPMDDAQRKAFAAKMRGAAVASRQGAPKPAAKPAPKVAPARDTHPNAPGNSDEKMPWDNQF